MPLPETEAPGRLQAELMSRGLRMSRLPARVELAIELEQGPAKLPDGRRSYRREANSAGVAPTPGPAAVAARSVPIRIP